MIKVFNDDCMNLFKTIDSNSIDLVVSDPPYHTTSRGNSGTSGGMCQKQINRDGKIFEYNDILPNQYAPELFRILKDNTHCYIMTNHLNLISMLTSFTDAGFHFTKSLIWNKGNKIMGQYYMSQFEYILFFRKGDGRKINNCGTSDLISIPNKKSKLENGENAHDTEKPVELMQLLITNSSNKEDIVCDPFVGSGSTPVACVFSNRNFIGSEIDKQYYDYTIERLKKANQNKKSKLF